MRKLFIISLLFIFSCKSKTVNLGSFDKKSFKKDRGGCEGMRATMIDQLKLLKPEILELTENQILENFGRYDFQILSRRNEKIFVYYLEQGNQCLNIQNETEAQSMVLRLNAASLAKEINFQNGRPLEVE